MKKIITLISILILFSCSKEKNINKIDKKNEPNIISKNDNVIFLNYKLTSSLKDFKTHTKKLINSNKIKQKNNKLIYSFLNNNKIKEGYIESNFYNEKLYKLDLKFENYRKPNNCFIFFKNHLNKKYGVPNEFEEYNSSPNNNYIARVIAYSKTYVPINKSNNYFYIRINQWIFNNGNEIILKGFFHAKDLKNFTNEKEDEVIITYIDSNIKKEKLNSIKRENEKKRKKENDIIENDL